MKPIALATIGVRLIGVALLAVGIIAIASGAFVNLAFSLNFPDNGLSDLHLHDTYYVVSMAHDGLFLPGLASLLVGIFVLIFSRRIARCVARGFADD
ncbi:MAG: hypothetical protein IPK15_05490 [Verrucomicrobia bacterium]|nr:hypothetical protein [Verrucomicrobiota bacterium]